MAAILILENLPLALSLVKYRSGIDKLSLSGTLPTHKAILSITSRMVL
jgi:hypothetical protein